MSRASESRPEFGLLAAGAVARCTIGQMRSRATSIGPVAGVSLRVASRIANSLRAGTAVRLVSGLAPARHILFHSPPDYVDQLLTLLAAAEIAWPGRCILFCDTQVPASALQLFRERGAALALILPLPGLSTAVLESDAGALALARRVLADTSLQSVEIPPGRGLLFSAAHTLGTSALTPLVDRIASVFRGAGLRDSDAVRLAARLVAHTAAEYAHSGKQSWLWHVRPPDPGQIAAQIAVVPEHIRPLFRELILTGFSDFGKHPDAADCIRSLANAGFDLPAGAP